MLEELRWLYQFAVPRVLLKVVLLLSLLLVSTAGYAEKSGESAVGDGPDAGQDSPVGAGASVREGATSVIPAYQSSSGTFQPTPLPQNQQNYSPDTGRFSAPDANTPQRFNPRDPARGYHPPGR